VSEDSQKNLQNLSTDELNSLKADGRKLADSYVKGLGDPTIPAEQKEAFKDVVSSVIDDELRKRGEG